jgi:hypothetical protein
MTSDYTALSDAEAEALLYTEISSFDEAQRIGYARIGLMMVEVERRLLWKLRVDPETGFPCRSFNRYVRVCAPHAYGTCYAAKYDVEALQDDISAADIAQIPQSNFATLKSLSTAVRKDRGVLAVAKTGATEALVSHIQREHPEQHIEQASYMRFKPTLSQREDIEHALELAKHGEEISATEALWRVCVEYAEFPRVVAGDEFGDLETDVVQ